MLICVSRNRTVYFWLERRKIRARIHVRMYAVVAIKRTLFAVFERLHIPQWNSSSGLAFGCLVRWCRTTRDTEIYHTTERGEEIIAWDYAKNSIKRNAHRIRWRCGTRVIVRRAISQKIKCWIANWRYYWQVRALSNGYESRWDGRRCIRSRLSTGGGTFSRGTHKSMSS